MKINGYNITIKRLNIVKHIDFLSNKYELFDIKLNEEFISFSFKNKDKNNILNYIKINNIKLEKIDRIGALNYILNLDKIGIYFASFLFIILWIISSLFLTKIVVYGTTAENVNLIKSIIKDLYNTNVILKSNVNPKDIENKIVSSSKLNLVNCIIKGNSLIINVKPELDNNTFLTGDFSPIISMYDCKVTSINVKQGTKNVDVGQIVKLGDVLVFPYVKDVNNNIKKVQPIADIVCDVWIKSTLDVYDTTIVKTMTGRKTQNRSLSFLGKQIFNDGNKNPYKNFRICKKTSYVSSIILPIKSEITEFIELKDSIKKVDFAKEKQNYINKCREIAFHNMQKYDIIKDEKQIIDYKDNKHTITCIFTISKKIC